MNIFVVLGLGFVSLVSPTYGDLLHVISSIGNRHLGNTEEVTWQTYLQS